MGFDADIFTGEIDENLVCSICNEVFKDPVQIDCDHTFCRECIEQWFFTSQSCPIDRRPVSSSERSNLKPASRIIKNLIDALQVKCIYNKEGCNLVMKLESRNKHASECDFKPDLQIKCPNGCGVKFKKREINKHICKILYENLQLQHEKEMELLKKKHESEIKELKHKHDTEISVMFESEYNPVFGENAFHAIYDYSTSETDEVSLIVGDFIFDCEPEEEGWLKGTVLRTRKTGLLPSNFVKQIKLIPETLPEPCKVS
jgi:hypothetical protein